MRTLSSLKAEQTRRNRALPSHLATIAGTSFKLAIPYSIDCKEFTIGTVRFQLDRGYGNKKMVRALDPIPSSWLIDLYAVEEVTE